ncbi:hypothetical protein KL86DYS1_11872 [uncultured Dysgonomonas sp.]|uniref:Uncharacterized protein n=1 Tax=uncultured Dysgonomonas sp. TaxID=206096 RepID=A0A212JCV4_9BACT|nr:hypothetical protein KL86DYS1_11872 [uncultured Dysgonomonas sp.]
MVFRFKSWFKSDFKNHRKIGEYKKKKTHDSP